MGCLLRKQRIVQRLRNAHLHVYTRECRGAHAKFRESVQEISSSGNTLEKIMAIYILLRELNTMAISSFNRSFDMQVN